MSSRSAAPSSPRRRRPLALVTGATGYIGGRLVPALLDSGFRVRVLVRDPARLRDKPWLSQVSVVAGDAGNPQDLAEAMKNVNVAYYLMHSLSLDPSFEQEEERIATVFATAASTAKVQRVIYLGALGDPGPDLSPHLRSRLRVGDVLRNSGVPTIELRAAVILGSGSASFEMLRYLTERLPVMTTPKWVHMRIQPIAVRDVIHYLVGAASLDKTIAGAFDIGGPDILTYADMMVRYAQVAGLPKPKIIPVPVLSPGLSSHWVGLITPVPASIARPLVESLKHEVVCRDTSIKEHVPDTDGGLLGFDEACRLAIKNVREANVATRWSEASTPHAPSDPWPGDPHWAGGSLYVDRRDILIDAPPEDVWQVLEAIGGDNGWHSWPSAWKARGFIDRLVGGVGLRRGRRSPKRLDVGDALDFWRVEERIENLLLRLRAEMRLPGLAWLEFSLVPTQDGRTVLTQRALFHPRGLAGHAYWRGMLPAHAFVFGPMAHAIAREAEELRNMGHPSEPDRRTDSYSRADSTQDALPQRDAEGRWLVAG